MKDFLLNLFLFCPLTHMHSQSFYLRKFQKPAPHPSAALAVWGFGFRCWECSAWTTSRPCRPWLPAKQHSARLEGRTEGAKGIPVCHDLEGVLPSAPAIQCHLLVTRPPPWPWPLFLPDPPGADPSCWPAGISQTVCSVVITETLVITGLSISQI